MFSNRKIHFGPGCPRTEEFVPGQRDTGTRIFFKFILSPDVPGHLLLPLSQDKGTPGQEIFFVPGQRDKGTSRPLETLVCSVLHMGLF